MKLPISWLKDFVDLKGLSVEEIARQLTLAGLEVGEITYAGLATARTQARRAARIQDPRHRLGPGQDRRRRDP